MNFFRREDSSREKIDIEDLKTGMFIEDVIDKNGVRLITENSVMRDKEKIENLKDIGAKSVFINIEKGEDYDKSDSITNTANKKPDYKSIEIYDKEITDDVEVHEQAVKAAASALKAVSAGSSFSAQEMRNVAEDIASSILRNPDSLISMSQIKNYDEYTYTHSVNVGVLITSIANSIGYNSNMLVEVAMGGLLHDIGKMRISKSILNKPGKLTDNEFAIIKRHAEYGIEAIRGKRGISDITKKIILQHHERYNGTGYPFGIRGDKIHEVGFISAVADVYDALTSDKVYKSALTPQKALALIFKGCDSEYPREIVEVFTKHMGIFPVGSFVKLVSGEMGIVVYENKDSLLAPKVLMLFNRSGIRLEKPLEIDLSKKQKEKNGNQYKIEVSLDPKTYHINVGDYLQRKI